MYECSVSAATNGGVGDASETAVTRTEQDGELTTSLSPPVCGFVVFMPIIILSTTEPVTITIPAQLLEPHGITIADCMGNHDCL